MHLPQLITDLGFILITAAAVTLLFRYLKQPVVLGYLVAGFLVGPHVPLVPTITDTESVKVWAEMGVIFLLFGLGLEFSFKKLAHVGKSAAITALVEVLFMLGLGFLCGQVFGWSKMDSLFLGGILAISSTTIIVRAFDELGLKGKKFVSLVFGVLIVEDLFAILLLVLLSTIAVTQSLAGTELLFSSMNLVFFLVLWFVIGIFVLPAFLKKARALLADETMLIVSIGLCLTMVMLTTAVGFSPALGAFVMGSILAETREGRRIELLIVPVRDLFAAVFFVSIGMLIDPKIQQEHFAVIVLLTLITIAGKLISTGLGAVLSGQKLQHAVQSGMSLAQIGEFSFIIATLGLTLNVTSDFLYPVAVAVSAVTTFTTPYMIKYADPFYSWLEKRTPNLVLTGLEKYRAAVSSGNRENALSLLWKAYGLKIALNSVIVIAIALAVQKGLLPHLVAQFGDHSAVHFAAGLVAILFSTPFLWPIIFATPAKMSSEASADLEKLKDLQLGVVIVRFFITVALVEFVISRFSPVLAASGIVLFVAASVIAVFGRYTRPLYLAFERTFLLHLNDREEAEKPIRAKPQLAPWDATLAEFTLSADSNLVLKTLAQSGVKERFGVTVAMIERGNRSILTPGREDLLLPADRLFLIGTEEQLERIRPIVEVASSKIDGAEADSFGLESMVLKEDSPFVGKSIRTCGLREAIHGLIVGIERSGQRILSPDSGTVLLPGDLIWVVGDRKLIKSMTK